MERCAIESEICVKRVVNPRHTKDGRCDLAYHRWPTRHPLQCRYPAVDTVFGTKAEFELKGRFSNQFYRQDFAIPRWQTCSVSKGLRGAPVLNHMLGMSRSKSLTWDLMWPSQPSLGEFLVEIDLAFSLQTQDT